MDLVTGGSGFFGARLAHRLLACGRDVRVFDVEESDLLPAGVEFARGDMRDYRAVSAAVSGCDVVYHLAFVQAFSRRPESEKWQVNFGGTENFLRASVEEGVERFVHTSTIELYSPFPPFPCPEEAPTDRPFGWYGRHKKACEELCWRYHWQFDLPVTMARLPTICGRGYYVRLDFLRALDWVLAGRPVLWIGGRQFSGDFVWVEDCVDAYLLLGSKPEAVGEVFNVSCSRSSTSLEIIKAIMDTAGNMRKVHLVPPWLAWPPVKLAARTGILDMPAEQLLYLMGDYSFSVDKARRLLGYAPKMSAAEAMVEMVKGYIEDRDRVMSKARAY
ncbi:MAG: NAD-dependent epimerase/dehydratase family protein [Candidatus Geothermincolia bacterium]